jgi:hypothetical protein
VLARFEVALFGIIFWPKAMFIVAWDGAALALLFIRKFSAFSRFLAQDLRRVMGMIRPANLTWSDRMSKRNEGAISEELHGVNLGDQRLNKRSQQLIASLAIDPQLSINAACDGWDETHAAYQFLDNAKVTPDKILQPHRAATLRRMQTQPVVLIPQDTTELDYTAHPAKDAKCLNLEQRFGFYEHVQLAVTPAGLPLGVVGTESHDREPASLGHAPDRRTAAIEDKESLRWLQAYREACELQALCPATQVVSIADREGDIYDLYVEHRDHVGPRPRGDGQAASRPEFHATGHRQRGSGRRSGGARRWDGRVVAVAHVAADRHLGGRAADRELLRATLDRGDFFQDLENRL